MTVLQAAFQLFPSIASGSSRRTSKLVLGWLLSFQLARELDVAFNQFNGGFPAMPTSLQYEELDLIVCREVVVTRTRATGNCHLLVCLNFKFNLNFTGKFKLKFLSCGDYRLLDLGSNHLTGTIPTWLSNLQSLV